MTTHAEHEQVLAEVMNTALLLARAHIAELKQETALLRTALEAYRLRAEAAEARQGELEAENALLKRALAMLTRSLEDAEIAR